MDGTVGLGGHAAALLPHIQPGGRYIGLDLDEQMLRAARARLGEQPGVLTHRAPRQQRRRLRHEAEPLGPPPRGGRLATDRAFEYFGVSRRMRGDAQNTLF